jgi:subtilisin family serine protease
MPVRSRPSVRAASSARPRLVFVHGAGPQPAAPILLRAWETALFGAPVAGALAERLGLAPALAYYADVRHGAPPTRQAQEFAARLASALSPGGDRGALVTGLPPWLRIPLTKVITSAFVPDITAYLFDAAVRERMRAPLRALLRAERGEVVLVAHSLGTIIAYDVLHEPGAAARVRRLVTLGSPLGIEEVQDLLRQGTGAREARTKANGGLTVPPGVADWTNLADRLDPVALDATFADEDPARTRPAAIRDVSVVNPARLLWREGGPHAGAGYLATPEAREEIGRGLGLPQNALAYGRLLRRDVLGAMLDRESRHSVLLEIRDPVAYPDARVAATATTADLDAQRAALVIKAEGVVRAGRGSIPAAAIDPLRRFVAARLTSSEIEALVVHAGAEVYCVWKNAKKHALLHRSPAVVHAPAARATYGADGRNVTWAVLDTGIDAAHPHFAALRESLQVFDCTKPGAPRLIAKPTDPQGHGTHVSGIVAGQGVDEGRALAGVAPRARLVVYKVLSDAGEGDDGWIIKALDHIAETNEKSADLVIAGVNLSLGGPFDASVYGVGHSPLCQELRRLWRGGVLAVVACGNDGRVRVRTEGDGSYDLHPVVSVGDPANLEECIAVGSVHADRPHVYGVSYFSSRGPTADGRAKPDVVAPGENIRSCRAGTKEYVAMSGTSMAAPHVSGLLAAFLSARPEFIGRPDEVKQMLLAACTDLGRDRYVQGRGLPNLLRMLTAT